MYTRLSTRCTVGLFTVGATLGARRVFGTLQVCALGLEWVSKLCFSVCMQSVMNPSCKVLLNLVLYEP